MLVTNILVIKPFAGQLGQAIMGAIVPPGPRPHNGDYGERLPHLIRFILSDRVG